MNKEHHVNRDDKHLNFPALAKRTFDQFRNDPFLGGVLKRTYNTLRSMGNPIRRSKWIHERVDEALGRLFKNKLIAENISCHKGCNACCHTQVSVNEDEAYHLAQIIKKKKVNIDRKRLIKQAAAGNSGGDWYKLEYKDRRCIFLDGENKCSIYTDRPSVCRTNYVFSDPKDCETAQGEEKPIRMLNTFEADMVVMASFINSQRNGALPKMVAEALGIKSKNSKIDRKSFPSQKDID